MGLVVEVGANDGCDTKRLCDGGANRVICFEPLPELAAGIRTLFTAGEDVTVIELAVDIEERETVFYVGENDLSGISSLYDLVPDVQSVLGGAKPFERRIPVQTIRLDTVIDRENIQHIDFLWIDAQGNDFRVLQSLGRHFSIVQAGKCETTFRRPLYGDADNSYLEIANWLVERGFDIIVMPSGGEVEADIYFRRNHG